LTKKGKGRVQTLKRKKKTKDGDLGGKKGFGGGVELKKYSCFTTGKGGGTVNRRVEAYETTNL